MNTAESLNNVSEGATVFGVIWRVALGLLSFFVVLALLLPAFQSAEWTGGRRAPCVLKLKQIGLALQNYHDQQKTFPPAYLADDKGRPMHSWRALLLPYMEEEELVKLGKQYRFDEPWNGPHNRNLAAQMPDLFRCSDSEAGENETSYVAVVGSETPWPDDEGLVIRAITDGSSKTISVVEIANSDINWLEPRDLTFEQATQGINPLHSKLSISSSHNGGANVLFSDSSVHFLTDDIPPETLRALLTRAGGEDVELPE